MVICSCNNGRQENSKSTTDTIFVLYYVTDIESSVRITKDSIAYHAEKLGTEDIIPLKKKDFNQIKNLVIACHSDSVNQEYDSRIHLKVDTFQMCLPYYEGIISQKDIAYKNLETVYLLKWKSGFYNTIPKNELKHQRLLNEFGIPKDYHFIRYSSSEPPFKLLRKVAFVKESKLPPHQSQRSRGLRMTRGRNRDHFKED